MDLPPIPEWEGEPDEYVPGSRREPSLFETECAMRADYQARQPRSDETLISLVASLTDTDCAFFLSL